MATLFAVGTQRERIKDLLVRDDVDNDKRSRLNELDEELLNVSEHSERAAKQLSDMSKVDLHKKAEEISDITREIEVQSKAAKKADNEKKKNESKEKSLTASISAVSTQRGKVKDLLARDDLDDSTRNRLEEIDKKLLDVQEHGKWASEGLANISKVDLQKQADEISDITREIEVQAKAAKEAESKLKSETATTSEVDKQYGRVIDILSKGHTKEDLDDDTKSRLQEIAKELLDVRENSDKASEGLSNISKVDLHAKEEEISRISRQIKVQAEQTKIADEAKKKADADQKKIDDEAIKKEDKKRMAVGKARDALTKKLNKTKETIESDEHFSAPFDDDASRIETMLKEAKNGEDIHQAQIAYNNLCDSINKVAQAREEAAEAEKAESDRRKDLIKQSDDAYKQYEEENKSVSNLIADIPKNTKNVLKKITGEDLNDRAVSDVVNGYISNINDLKVRAAGVGRGSEASEIEDYFRKVLSDQITSRLGRMEDLGIENAISGKLKTVAKKAMTESLSFDFIKELRGIWDEADKAIEGAGNIGSQKPIDALKKKLGDLDSNGAFSNLIKEFQNTLDSFTTDTPVSELKELEEAIDNIKPLQSADLTLNNLINLSESDIDFADQFGEQLSYLQNKAKEGFPVDETQKFVEEVNELKASADNFTSGIDEIVAGYKKLKNSAKEIANLEYKNANGKILTSYEQGVKFENEQKENELRSKSRFSYSNNKDIQKAESEYIKQVSFERQKLLLADIQKMYGQIDKGLSNTKFSDDFKDKLNEYKKSLGELEGNILKASDFDSSSFENANSTIKEMKTNLESMSVKGNQFASLSQVLGLLRRVTSDIANNNLSGQLLDNYKELEDRLKKVADAAQNAGKELTSMNIDEYTNSNNLWKKYNTEMYKSGMAGKGFLQKIKDSISSQSSSFIAQYFSLQAFIRYGREIVQTVTTIDSSMTELRKVSGETDTRLAESFKQSAATAKELGATISDVINSTADWSRLGYDINQAEELARVTQIYQNVGDNLTQETASEYLVSTLQGFRLNSDEALRVVDSINSVANNYAVDTQMIGESLERSAASFNASGTDLNKAIALVSATAEVTQDAASAGTVWKTSYCLNVQKCA